MAPIAMSVMAHSAASCEAVALPSRFVFHPQSVCQDDGRWGEIRLNLQLTFREALPRDADRIASLHADSWRRTYCGLMPERFLQQDALSNRQGVWRARLSSVASNQFVMLAEHEEVLAGFICVFGDEDVLWGSLVDNLHVAAPYARKGVGTQLMARASEWLGANYSSSRVYLWAMEANAPARQFYEQLGGLNVGTRHRLDAGGGSALNCRYVWQRPQALQIPSAR
jgi:GNAT superfamily N-acetyltransferase